MVAAGTGVGVRSGKFSGVQCELCWEEDTCLPAKV